MVVMVPRAGGLCACTWLTSVERVMMKMNTAEEQFRGMPGPSAFRGLSPEAMAGWLLRSYGVVCVDSNTTSQLDTARRERAIEGRCEQTGAQAQAARVAGIWAGVSEPCSARRGPSQWNRRGVGLIRVLKSPHLGP